MKNFSLSSSPSPLSLPPIAYIFVVYRHSQQQVSVLPPISGIQSRRIFFMENEFVRQKNSDFPVAN